MTDTTSSSTGEITRLEAACAIGLKVAKCKAPALNANSVRIRPAYSFISAGTELHSVVSVRAMQPGSHGDAPLGYSLCGEVVEVGENISHLQVGEQVVAIGAGAFHATEVVVARNLVVPVPQGVSPRVASLLAMACFAIEGVYKSAPKLGENVVVFGAGMMGQIAARLYHLAGARVCVMDMNRFRLGLLPEGIDTFFLDDAGWEQLAKWAAPYGVEGVNICFGGDGSEVIERLKPIFSRSPDGIIHGRVVVLGGTRLTVNMASALGNVELVSSAKAGPGYRDPIYESGQDYPAVYTSHTVRRNVEVLLALMQDGRLDLEPMITHEFDFDDAPAAFDLLEQNNVPALAVLLKYPAPRTG